MAIWYLGEVIVDDDGLDKYLDLANKGIYYIWCLLLAISNFNNDELIEWRMLAIKSISFITLHSEWMNEWKKTSLGWMDKKNLKQLTTYILNVE